MLAVYQMAKECRHNTKNLIDIHVSCFMFYVVHDDNHSLAIRMFNYLFVYKNRPNNNIQT